MERITLGALAEFFQWSSPTSNLLNISPEALIASQQQLQQLLLIPQSTLPPLQPLPTVTPPPSATSSPISTLSDSLSSISPPISDQENKEEDEEKPLEIEQKRKMKRRSPVTSSKNYSDCEKKHFLDVAYENNWGTTVAANKFNRVWGKGPTRRMFYWWRGQFKKEHDRDQIVLESLYTKKREGSKKLADYCRNPEGLADEKTAKDAQQCLKDLEANDKEIESLINKKKLMACSITGEKCAHGNGIQEDTVARKFTTPFVCAHCEMPFQKESTRQIHQILCETRFVNPIQADSRSLTEVSTPPPPPAQITVLPATIHLATVPTVTSEYTTKLTELTESILAALAAYSGATTVISN
ncbi:hypothetical protein L3Y34_005414 [Caenorhabditis briggsae]|uniref:Uncharacterized protein n=2 Tax=Caenorhabditis briggsae TaxID=6238 RepID=A0AAE9ADN9_CAEBR|nr:hypothetical protein L3Y34_005414 [Caenorhabditis briggsae]